MPRSHRTVFLEAATNRPGRTVSPTDSSERRSRLVNAKRGIGSRSSAMTRSLPHRGPQGWRKWCCAATKRFCMRSSATVPSSRCSGPTLLSWRQCASVLPSSFTCALHATHRRRQPGSMMMIAVRGRSGTGRASPATGLDQPSSDGATAALPGCGRDMNVMDPASMRLCAAGLGVPVRCENEQPEWHTLAGHLPHHPGEVADTCPVCSRHGNVVKRYAPTRVTLKMNVLSRGRPS